MDDLELRDSVTLHSSWRGIIFSIVGALLLAAVAVALLIGNGIGWVTVVFGLAGVGAVLVVLFDLPIATELTAEGLTRRALLRRHHIPWRDVTRIARLRVGVLRTRHQGVSGGLVADVAGRKYTLVDTVESPHEFDRFRALLGPELAERLGVVNDRRPPDGVPPTWLYRRSRWKVMS